MLLLLPPELPLAAIELPLAAEEEAGRLEEPSALEPGPALLLEAEKDVALAPELVPPSGVISVQAAQRPRRRIKRFMARRCSALALHTQGPRPPR